MNINFLKIYIGKRRKDNQIVDLQLILLCIIKNDLLLQ